VNSPWKEPDIVDWQSIYVYYYDADKDALILEGVRPLFHHLAGRVGAASFTRHWRQGPHLRLSLRTEGATFDEVVRPAAEEIVGEFLARRPSTLLLDPESELPAHQRLAQLENERGPLRPWHPDNSIQIIAFDRREETLGNRVTADLVADFHADTTELAFRMIDEVRGAGRRALAFSLMIATAHALSRSELTRAFVSFRSHAESFLHVFPEAQGLRPIWDEHYGKHAGGLVQRVASVTAALDRGDPAAPFIGDWIAALRPYQEWGAELIRTGAMALPSADRVARDSDMSRVSPFHRRLYTNPRWERTRTSADFQLYRLMLNLTYLYLTRLGITPVQRFLLCHLAANAVEERYGISAYELVGEAAR
jgi:hypothetical protein